MPDPAPLPLIHFESSEPPGEWVAPFVAVEIIIDRPDGTIKVEFTLDALGAN